MGWTLGGLELALNTGVGGTNGGFELMASGDAILRLRQRTAARVEVFMSRRGVGGRSGYVATEGSPIWREDESETLGRPETAWEERSIGLCQVVRGLAKMPSFLPHLPTFPKWKTQIQNYWIPQFEFFGKLVKCKPQLQNRWRCSD